MAEAFGLAASIFATIQIADRVISICKDYVEGVRSAPADLRFILLETSTLKTILENIVFLCECDDGRSTALHGLSGASGPVAECHRTMRELEGLFPVQSGRGMKRDSSGKLKAQVALALTALAWPLKEGKARKLLQDITTYKNTISLAIAADTAHNIRYVRQKADQIQANLNEAQRREVFAWLESTQPSELHYRALRNFEPGTCDWAMRLPEWPKFLNATEQHCLWIHGIPGAGKTILASQLIRHIENHCKALNTTESTSIYYYCYFGHNQDESTPFLKWVLNQLCREADKVSDHLWKLFKQGGSPCLDDLLTGVSHVLDHFSVVYITIDAVDESLFRENVLEVLKALATDPRFFKIRLLVTSREYQDIEKVLSNFSTSVSMKNEFLDADIRTYTHSRLIKESRFRGWPQDLREDTLEALSQGAKGMFRWVVCQIDVLRRIKYSAVAIREELKRLPKTLDEAYDRIFRQIPDEDLEVFDVAMKWMYYEVKIWRETSVRLRVLVEASNSDIATGMPQRNLFYDSEALLEVCGCLLTVTGYSSGYPSVQFAHYTVLEYLASSHRYRSDSFSSHESELLVHEKAGSVLRGALSITNDDIEEYQKGGAEWLLPTFASHCARHVVNLLMRFDADISIDDDLIRLVYEVFNPEKEHYSLLKEIWHVKDYQLFTCNRHAASRLRICWTRKPRTVVHIFTQLAMLECFHLTQEWLNTLDSRIIFNAQLDFKYAFRPLWGSHFLKTSTQELGWSFCGTITECFALLSSEGPATYEIFQSLIDAGEGHFDLQRTLLSSIAFHGQFHAMYCEKGYPCVLEKLLSIGGGAKAEMAPSHVTPLQIAVATLDVAGTISLLEAKADPNCKGCLAAEPWLEDDPRSGLNWLSGLSPLRICRSDRILISWGYFWGDGTDEVNAKAQSCIEQRLLENGAKD